MSNTFFANNRPINRRSYPNHGSNGFNARRNRSSMNFTDNFADYQPNFHNSTMRARNDSLASHEPKTFDATGGPSVHEKPSFSSLFSSELNISEKPPKAPEMLPFHSYSESLMDGDGVYLQISNLDQYYDEANLRHYLMSQLKPITPILSLTIETPSIAKVKVPSVQFAKQVISHLHRKKMGHKRIFVSFLKDKTSAECSALRNKVFGLLKDVPSHQLPMSKFRELFQSRFKSSISILDLYRMPDVCSIEMNSHEEKIISLQMDAAKPDADMIVKTEQHCAPYCIFHYKPDESKGWAEIEIEPLPNVFMTIPQVHEIIHELLRRHEGDIPVASLLYCIEELNYSIQPDDRGVNLEHLISCVPKVQIRSNDYGIKILAWHDNNFSDDVKSWRSVSGKATNLSNGDVADHISKEVIELIRMCPKSTMQFSKFIPAYHNRFGKQCRVADYGCTKLIEMFEAMSAVVQILGEGENRLITLTHQVQLRHFSTDVAKVLRNQPSKTIAASLLPQAFLAVHNRVLNVTDYGVCAIEDLFNGLRNSNFIHITKLHGNNEDYILSLQKSRQSSAQIEKTSVFCGEVVELLRNEPQFSIQFRKFVRSYHYMFGSQCKLNDYGFLRLAELLEALTGIVEMDHTTEESRKIFLSRKVALRIFSEQIRDIIKSSAGIVTGIMVKVDELLECHKNKCGYQMQGATLGYDTVIDALKYVPFVELNSYDNDLWLVSHLENEKFRQRAMLACVTIVDIGIKVSLSKFQAVFHEKFKFNIHEKTLHAMKHAVEIEMVNGIKMISLSHTMKFLMHISNIIEQRGAISIYEIKTIIKSNFSTFFKFGFPNLSSLIQAFPDLIRGTTPGDLHERSEVELSPENPFTPSGLQKLLAKGIVQTFDEKPKMFQMIPQQRNPTPPSSFTYSGIDNKENNFYFPQKFASTNPFLGDNTLSMTMPTDAFQRFNSNFHNPFEQGTSSGFYERNLRFQQQQQQMQYQQQKQDVWNSIGSNSSGLSSNSSSFNSFDHQGFNMMPYTRLGDPPKPDTPPSRPPTAIWFDPVWKCDNGALFDSNRKDGPKSFNVHVVSPFLSFKTMFTFDNVNPASSASSMNNQMQNM